MSKSEFEGWIAMKGPGFLGDGTMLEVVCEAFEAGQRAERKACAEIADKADAEWEYGGQLATAIACGFISQEIRDRRKS